MYLLTSTPAAALHSPLLLLFFFSSSRLLLLFAFLSFSLFSLFSPLWSGVRTSSLPVYPFTLHSSLDSSHFAFSPPLLSHHLPFLLTNPHRLFSPISSPSPYTSTWTTPPCRRLYLTAPHHHITTPFIPPTPKRYGVLLGPHPASTATTPSTYRLPVYSPAKPRPSTTCCAASCQSLSRPYD